MSYQPIKGGYPLMGGHRLVAEGLQGKEKVYVLADSSLKERH